MRTLIWMACVAVLPLCLPNLSNTHRKGSLVSFFSSILSVRWIALRHFVASGERNIQGVPHSKLLSIFKTPSFCSYFLSASKCMCSSAMTIFNEIEVPSTISHGWKSKMTEKKSKHNQRKFKGPTEKWKKNIFLIDAKCRVHTIHQTAHPVQYVWLAYV